MKNLLKRLFGFGIYFLFIFVFVIFPSDFLVFEKEFNCSNCSSYHFYRDNFLSPKFIVVFKDILYVLDDLSNTIFAFDKNNTLLYTISSNGYYDFLKQPITLTADEDLIYVIDKDTRQIYFFSSPTNRDYIDLNFFLSLSVPSLLINDTLWILDTSNDQIISFNLSSKEKNTYLSKGFGDGKISKPLDFTFKKNFFIVADTLNNRIQLFDKNLNFVSNIGLGSEGFILKNPVAVSADQDFIYVSDSSLKKIFILNYEGKLITELSYKELNLSSISSIYLYKNHIYFVSSSDKKILKFLLNKDQIQSDIKKRFSNLEKEFIELKVYLPEISSILPNSTTQMFLEVEGLIQASKNSFDAREYNSSLGYIIEAESKFSLLNQTVYSNLSSFLEQKLASLDKEIRNLSDINLAFKLKEDLDESYLLFSKNQFFLVINKTRSIEENIRLFYNKKSQPKKEEVSQNNTSFTPENEQRSFYYSFLDKINRKKESLIKIAEELDYPVNFIVFDQYLLAAKIAEKSSDFKKALDYLIEAENQLNSISEQLAVYQITLQLLDEYKKNISQISNSSTSISSVKLTKAYLIAKTNSTLALEEAKEALELAQKESVFGVFLQTKNYALVVFFIILALVLMIVFFVVAFLKKHLEKKSIDKQDFILIKKAKSVSKKRK